MRRIDGQHKRWGVVLNWDQRRFGLEEIHRCILLGFRPSLYPRTLSLLISVAVVLPISLVALIVSTALQMYGIAYEIPQLVYGTELMERPTWIFLGFASSIAGGIACTAARRQRNSLPRSQRISRLVLATTKGFARRGAFRKARWKGEFDVPSKVKNTEVDAHGSETTYDTDVIRLIDSLSSTERHSLRQELAKSRLAIRNDGVLIPREQAEMMHNIEEFLIL
ncbi:MAG: hypothetical protein OXE52_17065 [Chloroflexi bacterium]|nr:hypothetical protein [Chloroflexota bacterium]